ILGNVREVSKRDMENDPYYQRGDYTGDLGVEKSYESYLRGEKGVEILLRDAHGRVKGKYENGEFDKSPVTGKNLTLSIDVELQQYAELLMQNKIGAVVAIEPATGEILAMVSAPTFNPAELVGRERGKNYLNLTKNPYKPLYDRAISAAYPPGSTFKPTQGLIGLQEGVISTSTQYGCSHGYVVGRFRLGCHPHAAPIALVPALATSCNAYFCAEFRAMIDNRNKYPTIQEGFDVWKDYLVSMGYGYKTGIDLPSESRGFIPNSKYYDKAFRTNKWKSLNIVSISIGQGEVLSTPLQIANLSATIANRGYFITPHVVKQIEETTLPAELREPRYTMVDRKHYDPIVEGMAMAVTGGTCRIGAIEGIEVCGKTGTAQNPHGKDHSVFMGFAPRENPKIAIAVYVENAGFGATYGVPIGSLVMEKYLKGAIPESRKWLEDRMVNANTLFLNPRK
ncbi:MAG: penicillin-binding transpeptidase domain-containing protein, partial [Bacteroidales bacterium]